MLRNYTSHTEAQTNAKTNATLSVSVSVSLRLILILDGVIAKWFTAFLFHSFSTLGEKTPLKIKYISVFKGRNREREVETDSDTIY